MVTDSRLTRGRIRALTRLIGIASLLIFASGVAVLLAPLEQPRSLRDVAQATIRQYSDISLLFPKYSELVGERHTLFEFEEMKRVQVALRSSKQESKPKVVEKPPPPPPPPKPKPDIEGLMLVGTIPGSRYAFALLRDEQAGRVLTIARGENVRNAILDEIHPDKIIISLGTEKAELELPQIKIANAVNTNTVNTNAASSMSRSSASQVRAPVTTTQQIAKQSQTGKQPVRPSASSAGSRPAKMRNNTKASTARPPAKKSSRKKVSLGVSGHMLSSAKQQELGLDQTGLLITSVRRSDINVAVNDVLLAIDGQTFSSTREALAVIRKKANGDSIQMSLYRNGNRLSVTIPL